MRSRKSQTLAVGALLFHAFAPLLPAVPVISEFLASNDQDLLDEDGDSSDWIEVYNPDLTPVDLAGWSLTDDAGTPAKWVFPAHVLAPGGRVVVFASSKDRAIAGSELHTNFSLSSMGEYLALIDPVGVGSTEFNPFPPQRRDVSYGHATSVNQILGGGAALTYTLSTPADDGEGDSWDEEDYDDSGWTPGTPGIGYDRNASYIPLINTTVPNNTPELWVRFPFTLGSTTGLSSLTLNVLYDDGFEAYLNGSPVHFENAVPPISGHEAVDFESFDLTPHLPLLAVGQNVLAFRAINISNTSSDFLLSPELDASEVQAGFVFYEEPTPGLANTSMAYPGFVDGPTVGVGRGFYTAAFTEAIGVPTPGATLVYTTDGTAPTLSNGTQVPPPDSNTPPSLSLPINGTIAVRVGAFKTGLLPGELATHTYIFPADVRGQTSAVTQAAPYNLPGSWDGTSPDYGMDPDVVGPGDLFGGTYAATVEDDLRAVPSLSIVMDSDDLFGTAGIYSHPTSSGSTWERPTSLELIYPDGSVGFQEDCGIRIQGGAFRNFSLTRKKSFRVLFKNQYGAGKLDYDFFGDSGVSSFDTITFRMESNDGWQWGGANGQPQFARDQFGRETQLAMGQPASRGTHMHLYINGVYWGFYNPVERPDASFAESYFDLPKDEWDGINSGSATNSSDDPDRAARALAAWNELVARADAVAAGGTVAARHAAFMDTLGNNPDGTNNPARESYLDVTNYIDYLLVNYYSGNSDWPRKNYYCGRHHHPDSEGFKFFMWDAEWSLFLRSNVTTDKMEDVRGVAEPFISLRSSEAFKLRFGDRAHRALFNGGVLYVDPANPDWDPLHPERNRPAARYHGITERVKDAIVAESARWGDQHRTLPYTVDAEWATERDRILDDWMPVRSANFLQQLKDKGLYPGVDAPVYSLHGGAVAVGFLLTITNPNSGGTVYYTTDGTDPLVINADGTFSIHPGAQTYLSPVAISSNSVVVSRVLEAGEWSALNEALFSVPARLVISEFSYNPVESASGLDDGEDFEFIELLNVGPNPLDLGTFEFDLGVTFDFGTAPLSDRTLAPGGRALVVEDIVAFQTRYGTPASPILGQWSGKLSNSGETIRLRVKGGGAIAQEFTYLDEAPWPDCADGEGDSLVLINPYAEPDHNLPTSWRCSTIPGGTPGALSVPTFSGNPGDDGDGDYLSALLEHFLGSSDTDGEDGPDLITPGTMELGGGGDHLTLSFRRLLDLDDVHHTVESSTSLGPGTWMSGAAYILPVDVIDHGDGTVTETWRAVPDLSGSRLFLRLKVTSY